MMFLIWSTHLPGMKMAYVPAYGSLAREGEPRRDPDEVLLGYARC